MTLVSWEIPAGLVWEDLIQVEMQVLDEGCLQVGAVRWRLGGRQIEKKHSYHFYACPLWYILSPCVDHIFSEPMIQLCPATQNADSIKIHDCLSDGSYYETSDIMYANNEDNLLLDRKLGQHEFSDKESGKIQKRICSG